MVKLGLNTFFVFLLVGMFLINFGSAWVDNGSLVQDVDGCGNLIRVNAVYTLQNNVSSLGNCFNITSDNITINGNGKTITGDIYIKRIPYLQYPNLSYSNQYLLYPNQTYTNFSIRNSTLFGNIDANGISETSYYWLTGFGGTINVTDCNILGNISASGQEYTGPQSINGLNIFMINSYAGTIYSISGGASESIAMGGSVQIFNSTTGSISTFAPTAFGSDFGGNGGSVQIFNSTTGSISSYGGDAAAGVRGGNGGSVQIFNSTTGSISSYGGSVSADIYSNYGGNAGDITINGSIVNLNSKIINLNKGICNDFEGSCVSDGTYGLLTINYGSSFSDANASYGSNLRLKLIKSNVGIIDFSSTPLDSSAWTNLSSYVSISQNALSINSTALSSLNVSANITLYNLPTNMVLPKIMKDGIQCTDCYNFTSLNNGNVTFNVSSWSNYSIQDSALTSCGNLNVANTMYTLQNNVSTTVTCFNITADNITLDLNGYAITGDNSGLDYGIYGNHRTNITIKNGIIRSFAKSTFNGAGVYFTNSSFIYDINLSINSCYLGIFVDWRTSNSTFSNLSFFNNTQDIRLAPFSAYNKFYNFISSNSDQGIELSSSNNNYFENVIFADFAFFGIILSTSSNNTFVNVQTTGKNSVTNSGFNNLFIYNNRDGQINFSTIGIISKNVTFGNGATIQISSNSAYVNSSANTGLNKSANITLYNLPTNMQLPRIMKDGAICTDCYNFTSLNAGNVTFNVSSWSNYTIQDIFDPSNVTTCLTIVRPNTLYTLQNNVSTTVTCFTIAADNITLDLNGYSIIGNQLDFYFGGVFGHGVTNVTIKNGLIKLFGGSSFGCTGGGVYFMNSSFIYGINLSINSCCVGITGGNISHSTFSNIQVSNNYHGISLFGFSYYNNIYNFNSLNSVVGIVLSRAYNTLLVYNNTYGRIAFVPLTSNIGPNITSVNGGIIQISSNSAYVNSSADTGLNISANITLYNLPTNMVAPRIMNAGVVCTDCYPITSLNAGNVTFNVSSWSNYSIQDSALTSCGNLNVANTMYILQNNVSSNGVCFNISADNITLEGNGHVITGDINSSASSDGANASSKFGLHNATLEGNIFSLGAAGTTNGGFGGSVSVRDANISGNIISWGGEGDVDNDDFGFGGDASWIIINNSFVKNISSIGGAGFDFGGLSGEISIFNSTVSVLSSIGGLGSGNGASGHGGSTGNIVVNDSFTAQVFSTGGYGFAAGGSTGTISFTNSTSTDVSSICGGTATNPSSIGTISILDSTISNVSSSGGSIILTNSFAENVSSTGILFGGAQKNGGPITVINSTTADLSSTGRYGFYDCGSSSTINVTDSYVGKITSLGGDGNQGLSCSSGEIIIANSSFGNITSAGGSAVGFGNGASSGNVTILGSLISLLGKVSMLGGSGALYGSDGTLKLNQSGFFNSYGKIKFGYVSTKNTSFENILSIANNYAYVNSINYSYYNVSANITLNNLPTNMVLPKIMKDGAICSDCISYTSLNNGDVSFNVSSGGNYTIQDNYVAPPVTVVVSSSSSGGGGGGGVSSVGESGTNFVLAPLGSQSFILGGETHSIRFMSVSNGVYTFEIRSNPLVVSLLLGESKLVQVNGSLVNVSLYKSVGNAVYVSMKKIMDSSIDQLINVSSSSNNTASVENLTNTSDDGDSTASQVFSLGNKIVNSLLILIIAILVVFIIVVSFKKLNYSFSSEKKN